MYSEDHMFDIQLKDEKLFTLEISLKYLYFKFNKVTYVHISHAHPYFNICYEYELSILRLNNLRNP